MKGFVRKATTYAWHTVVCIAILAWILTAVWGMCYARSVYHRHQAERLLEKLKALQPGAASFHSAQKIAKEFGGVEHCTGDVCGYDFEIGFGVTDFRLPLMLRRTEWDHAGLRPWQVTAGIRVHNNEVTQIEWGTLVGRGRGWLYNDGLFSGNDWGWWAVFVTIGSERFEQLLNMEKDSAHANPIKTEHDIQSGMHGILVKKAAFDMEGGGEALEVYLSPSAPIERRAVGFDINLRCATSMSSCTHLCQLAPGAWRFYEKSNTWDVDASADCLPR